ncbi:MAG: GGDEF domain-containing protein, partial [Desulfobulbaceae bacterium]|nr:GGDEF domain-containing protein [Desulfobulbaceae bacterium]
VIADALQLLSGQTGMPPPLPDMEKMRQTGLGEFKEMATAVLAFRTAIQERHQAEEKSITDELTGLRNRRFLMTRFREEFERTRRGGNVLGFLMIDLDHFKNINDTCGHPFGDLVLQRVAHTLQGMLREYDVAGRYGGEEFAVVATGGSNSDLLALAERIRKAIGEMEIREGSVSVRVTISVGLAVSAFGDTQETLLKRADAALYQAKKEGRNRTVLL